MLIKRISFMILLFSFALVSVSSLSLADLFKSPEIFLVLRIELAPKPETAFFAKYWNYLEEKPGSGILVNNKPDDQITLSYSTGSSQYTYKTPLNRDRYLVIRCDIPSDGIILLKSLEFAPAGLDMFKVTFPFEHELLVPKDFRFAYLGTFEFELTGYQFELKQMRLIDDKADAAQFIAKRYGEATKLDSLPISGYEFTERFGTTGKTPVEVKTPEEAQVPAP